MPGLRDGRRDGLKAGGREDFKPKDLGISDLMSSE